DFWPGEDHKWATCHNQTGETRLIPYTAGLRVRKLARAICAEMGVDAPPKDQLEVPGLDTMAEDLAAFGCQVGETRRGTYQYLGAYIFDLLFTIFSVQLGDHPAGISYVPAPNECAWQWEIPAGWTHITHADKIFNVVETWALAAILLGKHHQLASTVWWCVVGQREKHQGGQPRISYKDRPRSRKPRTYDPGMLEQIHHAPIPVEGPVQETPRVEVERDSGSVGAPTGASASEPGFKSHPTVYDKAGNRPPGVEKGYWSFSDVQATKSEKGVTLFVPEGVRYRLTQRVAAEMLAGRTRRSAEQMAKGHEKFFKKKYPDQALTRENLEYFGY
ncbi:unnamed protein product, partial [Durusdinium trenchii]